VWTVNKFSLTSFGCARNAFQSSAEYQNKLCLAFLGEEPPAFPCTLISLYSNSGMTHVLSSIDSPWIEVIPIKATLPYTLI
jgi:hypothetical protein